MKRTIDLEVKRLSNLNRKLEKDIENNQDKEIKAEKQELRKEMQEGLTKKSGEIEESKIRKKKLETLEHVKNGSNKYLQT